MASTGHVIRVLAVDDHPIMLEGLAAVIEAEDDMLMVAAANSGEEAVRLHRQHKPDVTLMDLEMPGLSGEEAIRAIHDEFPDRKSVV